MKPIQTIFIDFDGVLHPVSALSGFNMRMSREAAIKFGRLFRWAWLLEDLLDGHDVQLVVHSSWRQLIPESEVQALMGPLGHRFTGITNPTVARWASIQSAVADRNLQPGSWLVLDDHASEFPSPLPSEVLLCDSETGVWAHSIRLAITNWLA